MVAGGVPEKDDHHASEICKMALDLLAKVYTHGKMCPFEVDTLTRKSCRDTHYLIIFIFRFARSR